MGDKRETYVTAWSSAQERELLQKGWTQVGRVYLHENDENPDYTCRPVLAPPKPPTLAERLRSEIAYGINSQLADDAADALDHYALVEAAARPVAGASDRMMGNFVLVDVELLWKLSDALNEGRKAPGADSL